MQLLFLENEHVQPRGVQGAALHCRGLCDAMLGGGPVLVWGLGFKVYDSGFEIVCRGRTRLIRNASEGACVCVCVCVRARLRAFLTMFVFVCALAFCLCAVASKYDVRVHTHKFHR